MNEPTMDNLEQRLDRLDRECRWLKRVGALVLLGMAAMLVMGQAIDRRFGNVIEAEKIVLRDATGKTRIALGPDSTGYSLNFYDVNGIDRATLAMANDLPILAFRDGQRKPRVTLAVLRDDTAIAALYGSHAKEGAAITVHPSGQSNFMLFSNGMMKARTSLGLSPGGPVGLAIGDQEGNHRLQIIVGTNDSPSLKVFNKGGKLIWSAPLAGFCLAWVRPLRF